MNTTPIHSLKPFWIFIAGAFGITWFFYGLAILCDRQLLTFGNVFLYLDLSNLGPFLMPIFLALTSGGRMALKSLASKLLNCRFNPWWWVVAIAIFPILSLGGSAVSALVNWQAAGGGSGDTGVPFVITTDLVILSIIAPILEEIGWRGYAMIELQKRFDALRATLLLGFLWGIWHFPTMFISGMSQSTLFFPGYVLNVMLLSFFFSWLFYNTQGSAILAILLHLAANATAGVFMNSGDLLIQNYVMIFAVGILLWVCGEKTMVYAQRGSRSIPRIMLFVIGAVAVNTLLIVTRATISP